jgi:hypothetical protein
MTTCVRTVVLAVTFAAVLNATDLTVTDKAGNVILVKNAAIDHTPSCCGIVRVDREHQGIRILAGKSAEQTVYWQNIKEVTIEGRQALGDRGEPLRASFLLRSGQTLSPVYFYENNIEGETELGAFNINLYNVKSISPQLNREETRSGDWKPAFRLAVTDVEDNQFEIEVYDAATFSMKQGAGTVAVQWSRVQQVEIERPQEQFQDVKGKVTWRTGGTISASFFHGAEVSGSTRHGWLKARIGDLKRIVVVDLRPPPLPKKSATKK